MAQLWTIERAAKDLGVPAAALERVAMEHGFVVQFGRSKRLRPEEMGELIEKCRVNPKAHASTGGKEKTAKASGKSETAPSAFRPGQAAAEMLKRRSRSTSNESTGQLVQLPRRK